MEYKFKIEKIEEDFVILKDEQGQSVRWPKNKLGKDRKEGEELIFWVVGAEKAEKENRGVAKDILNEILDA